MSDEIHEPANEPTDDVGELKSAVAKAGEPADTTGHLVYLAVLVVLFSIISGYAQAAAAVLGSLAGLDSAARAINYPQFMLDIADVYNSYPNFTSGIGIFGGTALLLLFLYSLFKRYKTKWVTYILGILFIGFYVNFLAWMNDVPPGVRVEDLAQLTPSAYHIILGGALFMLFGMWVGGKVDFVRALILFILGTFVIFEVQFSLRALQIVEFAIDGSWTTLPEMSFLYSMLGGVVLSLLILGGALFLIEALAYYDGIVKVKGLVFMMIVVAIPAAFLMWESSNATEPDSFLASGQYVRGGVAKHFKSLKPLSSDLSIRRAFVVDSAGVRDFELTIDEADRKDMNGVLGAAESGDRLEGISGEGLLRPELRSFAFHNIDIPYWKAELAALELKRSSDFSIAGKAILPYFKAGLWGRESLDTLEEFIQNESATPTSLRIAYARQLMHRGEFSRVEDILNSLKESLEILQKYSFIDVSDQSNTLAMTQAELEEAKALGAYGFSLRVRLEFNGKPVFGGIVGLQALGHKPSNVDEGNIPEDGLQAPITTEGIKSASELLTEFHKVNENGEVEFRGYIGGVYRLVVLAASLDQAEPDYLGYPRVRDFPAFLEGGKTYFVVVSF